MNHQLRKPAASFRRAASPILSTRRFKSARAGVRSPFVSQSSPRLCLFDAPRSCRSSELPPPGRCPSNGPSALLCGGRLTPHFHWSESVSTVILKGHLPPRSGLQVGSLSLSARGLLAVAVPGQDAADGGSLLLSGQFVFCLRLLTTFRVSAVSVYVEARASCRLSCLACARHVRRFAAGALV